MSAARARRRLMAFERYRGRALKLGASHLDVRWGTTTRGHSKAWSRVDRRIQQHRRWPMPHRCPWLPNGPRCPYRRQP